MPTQLLSIFEGDYDAHIRQAVETLRAGAVVVVPTDTVYGAAGILSACQTRTRLRQLRPPTPGSESAAFTLHLGGPAQADRYLGTVNAFGRRCIRKLWPGPVALVFDVPEPRRAEVAASAGVLESDLYNGPNITLRCPDHRVARDILGSIDSPIGAVMAGMDQLADGQKVAAELHEKVDLVVDAGPPRFSKPSTIVHVRDTGYEIVRTGIYDQRIIEKLLRTTILFVCSGNTCRSPMAEAITRHVLAQKLNIPDDELERNGYSVASAGAAAYPGSKATPEAVDAVRELGGDLSRHRSKPLSVELIHQADLVFTMSASHARMVLAMVPSAAGKVTLLNPDGEIEDPIGGDVTLYRELAGTMRDLIEKRLQEHSLP